MATKAAKGTLTRERIIQLAAPVFNRKGFAGASMADITEATGLQKGGVYNHFESKEQLAVEAFDYAIAQMIGRWKKAIEGKTHAADRLLAVVAMFDTFLLKPNSGGCPLMNTAVEADDNQPALRARARKAMDDCLATIRRIAAKGRERRELRAAANPEQVATVLMGTLEGALMISRLYGDARYLRQAQDQVTGWINRDLRA
jgi:TetR/AcrR family transcriptional regulator, transcriptional repressor for nem operon